MHCQGHRGMFIGQAVMSGDVATGRVTLPDEKKSPAVSQPAKLNKPLVNSATTLCQRQKQSRPNRSRDASQTVTLDVRYVRANETSACAINRYPRSCLLRFTNEDYAH